MRTSLILIAVFITTTALHAQKNPFKPGKVPMSEMKMKYYPGDSTVDAAILYDYGYYNVNDQKFNYLRRIKIFTREGLGHLIFAIPLESKSFFSGFVMNEVDGKIEKERISNDHIYIERSGGYSRVRVAPPNVREGSVVDIAYTTSGHPPIWQFQHKIPVRYSELYIPYNENFSFSFSQIGYEEVEMVKQGRYIARDMPAFRPEPYIDSENNYMTSMLIDLQSVHINHARGMMYKEVSTNWRAVNDFFVEGVRYYDRLKEPCLFLGDVVEDIRINSEDTLQRITRALEALHEQISWDENAWMYPGETLKEAWDKGSGNSADMNFIFLCMMRKLDVEAYPVLSSHRSRGKIYPFQPTVNKFNYTMSLVIVGDQEILVDASDKYAPLGMLPDRCLNGGGLCVTQQGGKWIPFTPAKSNSKMTTCNLKLSESGRVTGKMNISYDDYGAVSFRRKFNTYNSIDTYLEDFEKKNAGILVEEYENNVEEAVHGKVQESMSVEIDGKVTSIGDMITFNPVFTDRLEQNPFKLEKRAYPVDFKTPVKQMSITSLLIPEGYKVEQLPESVSMVTQNNSATFQYRTQQTGQYIQLVILYEIKKPVFYEIEYEELKMFFNLIVQKEQENIILKKDPDHDSNVEAGPVVDLYGGDESL